MISGKSKIDLSNPDGTSIQSNDLIPGFNVTVDSMLNIRNLCYIYAPSGSKYIGEYTNTPILTIQKPTSICPVAPPPVSSDTRTLLQLSWKDEFIASKVVQEAYKFTRRY